MPELIQAYWPYLLAALLIGIAVAWFVFNASRTTTVTGDRRDVLDEGAEPAKRNQALIDTPPGAGALSSAANADPVAAAPASADAEAGPEIVPTTATPEAAPASPASAPDATLAANSGDDLTRIKGLGPKLSNTLNDLGVTTFAQIANWNDAEIDRIDGQLGRFQGRIRRDSWVEQAKLLADGNEADFEGKFGNNG